MENKELTSINGVEELTKKDVTNAYLRWHFVNEIPHSYERYLAPSLLWALMPALKKLYKFDKEALKRAYKRQLLFFNTQLSGGGGVITGLMASMD